MTHGFVLLIQTTASVPINLIPFDKMTPNIVKGSNSLPGDRYDHPDHPRNNPAYQPNSLKDNNNSDTPDMSSNKVDGDHAAKTMDAGANAATGSTEMASGIHEDSQQTVRITSETDLTSR